MSCLCQNMKLLANKSGKLRLLIFFTIHLQKKKNIPPTVIRQPKHTHTHTHTHTQSFIYLGQGCQTFTNNLKLKDIKSHKSCGHQLSFNGSSDKKSQGQVILNWLCPNDVNKKSFSNCPRFLELSTSEVICLFFYETALSIFLGTFQIMLYQLISGFS